ncbi:hypothetical protein AK812_SmicGene7379 [Symbiodinium microadriaticum]|uniref:Uncharacterized protein n=1 Tax=Symbiodinium microadriaticum TaxID=2951 RepID=A0A1Q9ENR2_SYMMI|nr:hypothetical protein AK812_SmicGene7379 [Symbiodinium microadriaticum]
MSAFRLVIELVPCVHMAQVFQQSQAGCMEHVLDICCGIFRNEAAAHELHWAICAWCPGQGHVWHLCVGAWRITVGADGIMRASVTGKHLVQCLMCCLVQEVASANLQCGGGVAGGARHFAKSLVEVGALQKVLTDFESIVCDMRGYETLSRSSGYDWKGLIHCLPLVEGLLCLCKKAEVHTQPLKRGLTGLLEGKPSLNKTRFVGSVWVQLRQERIVVLLNHIRRLARDPKRGNAIQRLSGLEYGRLQEVLAQVSLEEADGEETLLKKGPRRALAKGQQEET